MTVEMGERDVDLGWHEQLAGRSAQYLLRAMNALGVSPSVRYNPATATVSLSGESEHSGDRYERGQLVSMLFIVNVLVWLLPIQLTSAISTGATTTLVDWAIVVVGLPYCAFLAINAMGSMTLIHKTDVIDHTTEPAPDALNELEAAYVDGEIDEKELGEKAAEVWER